MLDLTNITLINVNCVDPEIGVKALRYSKRDINFNKSILFSHYKPENLTDDIQFIEIPKLNHDGFSKFCIEKLNDYIDTDYVLSINTDGFVINSSMWTDEFFSYDYIGSPWPTGLDWCRINRVGNGGFCLKSKKFLELSSKIQYSNGHDDVLVTNSMYSYFVLNGVKYAPVSTAVKFSLEHRVPEVEYNLNNCFGFHGKLTEESRQYVEMIKTYDI